MRDSGFTERHVRIHAIDQSKLTSLDLRKELEEAGGPFAGAYRVEISMIGGFGVGTMPEGAEAVVIPSEADPTSGRIGIAGGTVAYWGDVTHLWATDDPEGLPEHICDGSHDIIQAIRDWLEDGDAWARRY